MNKYLYCLLIPIFITACSTNKNKQLKPVRLAAITIHGDTIPQYTFRYDTAGHLIELVKHNWENDTDITTFSYDSSHRLSGMVAAHQDSSSKTIQQRASVSAWDENGNIQEVQYYDGENKLLKTAQISWKDGLPVALKCKDSALAMSWSYENGNPDWKNICTDTVSGNAKDTSIFVRKANYEWDDSVNPLRALANQLLLGPGISPVPDVTPLPSITTFLLPVSTNNPTLIKVDDREKLTYKQQSQVYHRNTTVQFFYSYKNGYPTTALVHFHSEGYTKLGTDTQLTLDYTYL